MSTEHKYWENYLITKHLLEFRFKLTHQLSLRRPKAKFHYASWFEAGSKLVADRFEAKFHYAIWFEPASNQLRTSYSVMEFGF